MITWVLLLSVIIASGPGRMGHVCKLWCESESNYRITNMPIFVAKSHYLSFFVINIVEQNNIKLWNRNTFTIKNKNKLKNKLLRFDILAIFSLPYYRRWGHAFSFAFDNQFVALIDQLRRRYCCYRWSNCGKSRLWPWSCFQLRNSVCSVSSTFKVQSSTIINTPSPAHSLLVPLLDPIPHTFSTAYFSLSEEPSPVRLGSKQKSILNIVSIGSIS